MDVTSTLSLGDPLEPARKATADMLRSRDHSFSLPQPFYCDQRLFEIDMQEIFHKEWLIAGMTCEIPAKGNFLTLQIGKNPVLVIRGAEGQVHAFHNVCRHRGSRLCVSEKGKVAKLVCPYHQWNYSLQGDLQGVPFRRGVKQQGQVQGGMPKDFKPEEHGLTKLKVACRGGVVFASFDHAVEPLEDYLGPNILPWFDRVFSGRPLKILGYRRQRIPGNWKLMQENIKDPYHPGLLHTWFVTFGLWRADNKSQLVMDERHRHAAMISRGLCAGTLVAHPSAMPTAPLQSSTGHCAGNTVGSIHSPSNVDTMGTAWSASSAVSAAPGADNRISV